MSDRQIALEFLRRLSAKRIDEAAHLMADGLQLVAPSERNAFSVGEPRGEAKTQHSRHEVINVMEDEEGITVLYEYEGAVSLMIAQWFRFQNHRIVETELIYEPKDNHQGWSTLLQRGVRCELLRTGQAETKVPRRPPEPPRMETMPPTVTQQVVLD